MSGLHLVRGADPTLRSRAIGELVGHLVGDAERSLAVEDLTVPARTTGDAGAAVDRILTALASPPFMTDRRVVVLRDLDQLAADDAVRVAAALAARPEGVVVVATAGGGRLPKVLGEAFAEAEVRGVDAPTADVLDAECTRRGVRLSAAAARRVTGHLGDDAGRVGALVEVLAGAFGPGAELDVGEVEPYLTDAGAVRVWELTDRIEAGEVAGSLAVLHRLLHATSARQPRAVHPLQVLGLLHARLRRLARCDDPALTTAAAAAAALGGSPYAARRAWEAGRALGTDGIRRAYAWLVQADLDLKGRRAMGEEATLAVLVSRLAGLFATAGGRSARRGARSRPSGAGRGGRSSGPARDRRT